MFKKRHRSSLVLDRSSLVLKRHRSSVVESLPHDVVELILERLPVESLLKFKSVSNKWKSTIDSKCFQERQLIRRMESRGPDVLFVYLTYFGDDRLDTDLRIVFGSSVVHTVRFPSSRCISCHGSCDGLLCFYDFDTLSVVVNPATLWHQTFPLSNFQQLFIDKINKGVIVSYSTLGFGKDKSTGTYKPVWLYNSSEFGLDNVTTCEVFDFSTNAWRYVLQASPYRILAHQSPVYLDGSLYWLTDCEDTKVLSFDLHTETFHVISKAPFSHLRDPCDVTLCILDNRLCVSEKTWPTQVIWSLVSSACKKTWKKMFSIDLNNTFSWFKEPKFPLAPIAILDKNKLLLQDNYSGPVVIHDLHTKSFDLLFKPNKSMAPVYYFQSLFSN